MPMFDLLSAVNFSGMGQWFNSLDAWALLMAGGNTVMLRIGPLATYAFSPHFPQGIQHRLQLNLKVQVKK